MLSLRKAAAVALAAACAAALAAGALLARENKKAQAAALLAKARKLSNIRASGSPPFRLHAWLDFPSIKDPRLNQGSYLEIWRSPHHWRREIRGVGYDGITVRDGEKIYHKSNMAYAPWPVFGLDTLFEMRDPLAHRSRTAVRKVKHRKFGAEAFTCVVVGPRERTAQFAHCIGRGNSLLTSIQGRFDETEYAHYGNFGARRYPQRLRWSLGHRVLMDARVDTLQLLHNVRPGTFQPPPGSAESPACGKLKVPTKVKGSEPSYTDKARHEHIQGLNVSFVIISGQGKVIHAEIVQPLDPGLDASTLAAIRKWKFKPSACRGSAGEIGAYVETTFQLSP